MSFVSKLGFDKFSYNGPHLLHNCGIEQFIQVKITVPGRYRSGQHKNPLQKYKKYINKRRLQVLSLFPSVMNWHNWLKLPKAKPSATPSILPPPVHTVFTSL
nr:hypothetical protein MACL_00003047 [Theileria orientalis]